MKLPYSVVSLLVLTGALTFGWLRPRAAETDRVASRHTSGPVGAGESRDLRSRKHTDDIEREPRLNAWRRLASLVAADARFQVPDEPPPPAIAATPELPPAGDQYPPDPATTLPIEEVLSYASSGMRDVYPWIKDCFSGQTEKPGESTDGLSLRIVVEGDVKSGGIVTDTEVRGLSAEQADVASCVSNSVYAARFDPPDHGRTITLEMSFNPYHLPED